MDNRRGSLWFTIGSARSGKSTYCNEWVNPDTRDIDNSNRFKPRAIVCGDDIRMVLHGQRYKSEAEPMVWAIHTYMCKTLLRRSHDVIVDGTNTTKDSILRLLSIDPDARYVLIDTSIERCEQRALSSGQNDLVDGGVIRRHHAQIQLLKAEGIDNVVESIRAHVKARRGE